MKRLLIPLLLSLALLGCGSSALPSATSTSATSTSATSTPNPRSVVSVSGSGDMSTPPFELNGGVYALTWSVTRDLGSADCVLNAAIGDVARGTLIGQLLLLHTTGSGQGANYYSKPGRYYLSVGTTCKTWIVTFTPD